MKNKLTKKQIRMIQIGLPLIGVILIVVLVSGPGLRDLMGNVTFDKEKCTCEEGWEESDNNTCSQEKVTESKTVAYLLGDANDDGEINNEDLSIIVEVITRSQEYGTGTNVSPELDTRQEVVYDINKDGKVDYLDKEKVIELFGESSIGGSMQNGIYRKEYVCPKSKTEETKDGSGQTTTTKIDYKQDRQNQQICYITTTIKVSKKAVCTENKVNNTDSSSNKTEIEESKEEEPAYKISVETNICTKEECNNDLEIKTKSKDTKTPNEEPQSSEIIIKNNGEANDEE